MEILSSFLERLVDLIPTVIAVTAVAIAMFAVRFLLSRRFAGAPGNRFRLQLVMLVLSFVGLLVVILALPISETTTGQLLSLIGILLSAAIALSATTFVGNIMAGLMLRAVRNFRPGDFVRVGDHFGRVSEQGLFHIEIQTEDRDLTTMPNLYLVTNPVKVVRSSGTLITAEVSLGFDVPRQRVQSLLKSAAEDAGLEEPFVHIIELNDFSVTYRVAGLLISVANLLSTRSRLRETMLDRLHGGGVEIVSPTFMNQRVWPLDHSFIPQPSAPTGDEPEDSGAEKVIFDKADEAASLEKLYERRESARKELSELEAVRDKMTNDNERQAVDERIEFARQRLERLTAYIKRREADEPGDR